MPATANTIHNNFLEIRKTISNFEKKYHRTHGSVSLLAVSKKQSLEKMSEAIAVGQKAFGENYLQEALEKISYFESIHENLEWHFIGHMQDNKTRKIAEHFAWVHSLDKQKTAKRLNDQRPLELPPLNICLQINISQEDTKFGISPEEVFELAAFCQTLPRLRLRGIMALPAPTMDFARQRTNFHPLRDILKVLKNQYDTIDTLSIGTSLDLEAAIAEGATMVRIGTALFGTRNILP
ncbi:MAG: YggS family pyridoxal phosphate-dependent enzyme [Gammaproteobacteria bacterium]|nr:YggS family pyridoxal phosphate-dependent enzyme [Gammaproteobacteria bacterium]